MPFKSKSGSKYALALITKVNEPLDKAIARLGVDWNIPEEEITEVKRGNQSYIYLKSDIDRIKPQKFSTGKSTEEVGKEHMAKSRTSSDVKETVDEIKGMLEDEPDEREKSQEPRQQRFNRQDGYEKPSPQSNRRGGYNQRFDNRRGGYKRTRPKPEQVTDEQLAEEHSIAADKQDKEQ